MLNSIWLHCCVMWVCVPPGVWFPSEKLLDVTGMCWLESQPDLFFIACFNRGGGGGGDFFFFEWDHPCLLMGMNPPSARALTHGPGKQRPGTNYTNEWVSEIINSHLKRADVRALGHRKLNKSDHRASGRFSCCLWPALIVFLTAPGRSCYVHDTQFSPAMCHCLFPHPCACTWAQSHFPQKLYEAYGGLKFSLRTDRHKKKKKKSLNGEGI